MATATGTAAATGSATTGIAIIRRAAMTIAAITTITAAAGIERQPRIFSVFGAFSFSDETNRTAPTGGFFMPSRVGDVASEPTVGVSLFGRIPSPRNCPLTKGAYDNWLATGSIASCASIRYPIRYSTRYFEALACQSGRCIAVIAQSLRRDRLWRGRCGRSLRGAAGSRGLCNRAVRRAQVSGRLQAFWLRQPECAEGRHARAGQSEPPDQLR